MSIIDLGLMPPVVKDVPKTKAEKIWDEIEFYTLLTIIVSCVTWAALILIDGFIL